MRQSISVTREALRRLFFQRCFYLFVTLLALIAAAPFIEASPRGPMLTTLLHTFIILAAVAAVGRSTTSFLIVLCLAAPAVALRWFSIHMGESAYFDLSLRLHAGVYATAIALLLRYVFSREVMTSDRLWGAAAAYLMIGVLWTFLYGIVDRANPESFAVRGSIADLEFTDVIYFSFSTLTTTSYGDIVPLTRVARMASVIEGIVGQLFLAILIAKLVGVYPPPLRQQSSAQ